MTCTALRKEAFEAAKSLQKSSWSAEGWEQAEQARQNPQLMAYTITAELQSNLAVNNPITAVDSKRLAEAMVSFGSDFIPGYGDAKSFVEAQDPFDYMMSGVGLVPGLGDGAAKILGKAKALYKEGKVSEAADLVEGLGKLPAPQAAKGTTTVGEVAGTGARNPLLDDAIPRNGDRLVVSQGAAPTCGHNSCGMVLNTLGKEVDVGVLVQKVKPSAGGIYAQDVADLMKSEGIPASAFGNRNVADLTRYTSNGTPVVVRIADKTGDSDFSHFVVVDGVTTRNGVSVVAIRDPHGTQYFSPVATFEKSFTGEVVVPRSALK